MSTRHSELFFLTGLNYISENWLRAQVAAKPILPSSVTKSKFKPSKSKFKSSKSKLKPSKSKFKSSKSSIKQTASTIRPKKYSKLKSSVQPRSKSNARRRSFPKTGKGQHVKKSEEYMDTTGNIFRIHIERRGRHFDRSGNYGEDYQEEDEIVYLSYGDGPSDNDDDKDEGTVDCSYSDCSSLYVDRFNEAPELKKCCGIFFPILDIINFNTHCLT